MKTIYSLNNVKHYPPFKISVSKYLKENNNKSN